jgi:multidrug resistance protein, MATE family
MHKPSAPTRDILHLAWPMLVAQLAIVAGGVIDTAMAGRLSVIDLAAVGIGTSIQVTVVMSLTGILLALPPIVSHHLGANRHDDIGREVQQAGWIALLLGLLAFLLLGFPEPFIAISDLQPEVESKVRAYLGAAAWGVPASMAFRVFIGLSSGIGRPRPAMAFNLLTLALKVPLNAIFMYGLLGAPALEGPGCAVAGAIDAWLIAFLAWGWCLRQPGYARFGIGRPIARPDGLAIFAFLKLGIPIGLTFIADVTAFTFMALFIARLGPVASAAHQIASNVAIIIFMIPLALGNATAILAGQALGGGQPRQARHICGVSLRLAILIAGVVSVTLWLGAAQIAALYTPDMQVQAVAVPLILLVGFYHLFDAVQAVAVNALRGYKRSAVPMVIYTFSLWGLGLGGGVVLGLTDLLGPARGAAGFWMAAIASLTVVAGLVTLYLNLVSKTRP